MSNVVNLNRFRKRQARAEKKKRAEENRAKHGRRKDEVTAEESDKNKRESFLNGHKRNDPDS